MKGRRGGGARGADTASQAQPDGWVGRAAAARDNSYAVWAVSLIGEVMRAR